MISYERLCLAVEKKDWNNVTELLKPKYFPRDENGTLIDRKILAKVAETLTTQSSNMSSHVKIVLLKCLSNSCVEGYIYTKHSEKNDNLEILSQDDDKLHTNESSNDVHFYYDKMVDWVMNYITENVQKSEDSSSDRLEILRLCVQFLCNFITFACREDDLPESLTNDSFKAVTVILMASEFLPLARAACAFVHNVLIKWPEYYEITKIARTLIDASKLGINSATESLLALMKRPGCLRTIYNDLSIQRKLHILEIILQGMREIVYSEETDNPGKNYPIEVVQFLAQRFCKRSDLILKTVDSYLDGMEPMEVIILLDIIGVISSKDSLECQELQNDKSLVINCVFLLKSVHMTGKTSDNNFTPVQKLSEVAPNCLANENSPVEKENIQNHPAFGFKAALIRAIGNLAHRHKENQELLRETDAIPLLLDCCNIDARNPLIMQWTIFALRNLCDDSPENQEIIRNCNKVGIVDNDIIREMGMKLHEDEDGKAIGIIPLPRNK